MIDGAPDAIAECATRYAWRDDIEVIFGVFDPDGDQEPAVFNWRPDTMYSSLNHDHGNTIQITVPRLNHRWLRQRIQQLPDPTFVSIDLEGSSIGALGWIAQNTTATCVCVEANVPADRRQAETICRTWTTAYRNDWNLIFTR